MTTRQAGSTGIPLRAAMEARDLAAVVDAFTPDAVFHSPLTGRLAFEGREQIGAVSRVVLDAFQDFHYTDEVRSGDTAVLVSEARVGGELLEMVEHLRLEPETGRIREMTVFFRPLPATTAALRAIGAGLARRKGRVGAAMVSLLAGPLVLLTGAGDRLAAGLLRSTLGWL